MNDIRWKQRFENYEKALNNLNLVIDALKDNQDNIIYKMASIQAYEMAFELGWKALKDFLIEEGVMVNFPKDTIKEAFAYEIIEDGEVWIKMLNDRNLTSHTYDEQRANQVVNDIKDKYFPALQQEYTYLKGRL